MSIWYVLGSILGSVAAAVILYIFFELMRIRALKKLRAAGPGA